MNINFFELNIRDLLALIIKLSNYKITAIINKSYRLFKHGSSRREVFLLVIGAAIIYNLKLIIFNRQ